MIRNSIAHTGEYVPDAAATTGTDEARAARFYPSKSLYRNLRELVRIAMYRELAAISWMKATTLARAIAAVSVPGPCRYCTCTRVSEPGDVKMTVMKCLVILLAFATCGTGIWAAWKWHLSSLVSVELGISHPPLQIGGPRILQTADESLLRQREIAATWEAMNQTAYLNRVAAFGPPYPWH
jgi:hypothetical protein